MTEPHPSNQSQVMWNFGVAKGPDGKHWIVCNIANALNGFTFIMPPEAWTNLAEQLPKAVQENADACRRANMGLEVAGPDALKNIKVKENGRV